ncbi:hypothetical protein ACG04R_17345 [Roseateles sp. BYS78W]|uniref:Uncharacterized protein n=1 Tax=Pelomonas candidula TaxID=3299025 RepID=A0ABW7HEW8_9BURK
MALTDTAIKQLKPTDTPRKVSNEKGLLGKFDADPGLAGRWWPTW